MKLCPDLTYEVLKHLEEDPEEDPLFQIEDPRDSRQTLYRVACASHLLSDIALPLLWQRCSSLERLANVVNYFAKSPEEPIWYKDDNESWVSQGDFHEDQIDVRVSKYLRYIKYFSFKSEHGWETEATLWNLIATHFWSGRPLLPNLQELCLPLHSPLPSANSAWTFLFSFIPLHMKTIRSATPSMNEPSEQYVSLYRQLALQGYSLEHFEYEGPPFEQLPSMATSLSSLRMLSLRLPENTQLEFERVHMLTDILQTLPSLKGINVDLSMFKTEDILPSGPIQFPCLAEAQISGRLCDLGAFFSAVSLPSVRGVDLEFQSPSTELGPVLQQLACCCPTLEALELQEANWSDIMHEISVRPTLTLKDVTPFLSMRLVRFAIRNYRWKFSNDDIETMLKAWPTLRNLDILLLIHPLTPAALLSIARHQRLETLILTLDLSQPLDIPNPPLSLVQQSYKTLVLFPMDLVLPSPEAIQRLLSLYIRLDAKWSEMLLKGLIARWPEQLRARNLPDSLSLYDALRPR